MGSVDPARMTSPGWFRFWRDKQKSASMVLEVSTSVAARRLSSFFDLRPTQRILDYGCGPAFLAAFLAGKGFSVVGADINLFQIGENQKRYPNITFVHLGGSDEPAELPGEFDCIILLSVVQYLDSIGAVGRLIGRLRLHLRKGGTIILADVVDAQSSSLIDGIAAFYHCLAAGRPGIFFRFVAGLLSAMGRSADAGSKLLRLEAADMKSIVETNGMKLEVYRNLTAHPTRKTYRLVSQSG